MKPSIEVAAAIILHQGNVLISLRDEHSHLSGYWEFPGGKREPEETFEACLIREIREELNIDVAIESFFEAIDYEYAEKMVMLRFFFCRYLGGDVRALGCQRFKWVPLSDLRAYRFPPANEPIVRRLLQV